MNERRAAIMRQIQDLQSQLAQMEKLPTHDDYPDGTVIRAKIRFEDERHGKTLTYVLLKVSVPLTGVSYIGSGPPVESWWYFTGALFTGGGRERIRRTSWRHLSEALTAYGREVVSWDVMMPMDPPTPVTLVLKDDTPEGMYPGTLDNPFRLYVEDGEFVVR